MTATAVPLPSTKRGTTNGNARGSSYARRRRRVWLLEHYAADVPGFCRCYRCGVLCYNPDTPPRQVGQWHPGGPDPRPRIVLPDGHLVRAVPLTVDRIIPGCQGGTYRRNNIRPACAGCNSETGGGLRRTGK